MSLNASNLPTRLHHHAYTTDDHEKTRHFYEDVLGIPLTGMHIDQTTLDGERVELAHALYELADGSALVFFQIKGPVQPTVWRAVQQPIYVHIALRVEKLALSELERKLQLAGISSAVRDHGYCQSLYVRDPNGLLLEFTSDRPDAEAFAQKIKLSAHADLQRWVEGDRSPTRHWPKE